MTAIAQCPPSRTGELGCDQDDERPGGPTDLEAAAAAGRHNRTVERTGRALSGLGLARAQAQLGKLVDEGVTAEEVERAQNQLLAAAIYSQDSLASGPRTYGATLAIGGTMADIDAWPQRISAVTPASTAPSATADATGTSGTYTGKCTGTFTASRN